MIDLNTSIFWSTKNFTWSLISLFLVSYSAILIRSCFLFLSTSFKLKIELVNIDKLLFLNSTIPSSIKNFSSPDFDWIVTIPGFKKEIIEMWSFKIPISPSKAGTTTSVASSIDKKDEEKTKNKDINDQVKFLEDQKIDVLRSIN